MQELKAFLCGEEKLPKEKEIVVSKRFLGEDGKPLLWKIKALKEKEHQKIKQIQNEEIEKSKYDPIITIPVVILVNENSASASEILAGALKDNNRAKIVGTKTYGKGVIQELLTLKDGSAIKLTTEEYYTPNRTKINNVGIEPDELVENDENIEEDLQLKKAIEMVK